MGQIRTDQFDKAARAQLRAVGKQGVSMSSGERQWKIAAAETFRAEPGDLDAEYEEESWLEPEAQIAQFLGGFAARSDRTAAD